MVTAGSELLSAEHVRALLDEKRQPLRSAVDRLLAGCSGSDAAPEEVGLKLGRAHARVLDELFAALFPAAVARAGCSGAGIVLAGVGGYGRGTVALGADVDLRILARDLRSAERLAEVLLYPLWDAGLTLGHQVVTLDDLLEAAREDLPTATSLLDWRCVAGDASLSAELARRAAQGIFSLSSLPGFLQRLEREVAERHERFGGSVYMLEPDVKNGRGALRDLDVAWWAARARWSVEDFADLLKIGVLVPRQLAAVEEARERLWRIRNLLHALAGRRSDRLSFDVQEALARPLGYLEEEAVAEAAAEVRGDGSRADASCPGLPPAGGSPHDAALRVGVEHMMSDYYRAARTVSRFRELCAGRAMPTLRRRRPAYQDLGGGLSLFDGQAAIARPELLQSDPVVALRVVAAAVQHGVPLRPETRAALVDASGDDGWAERLRDSREAAALFVELSTSCAETRLRRGSVMRELHDVGLLLALIPEFLPVVGRVHHDTYHVYTVDVHSVAAVDRLCEIIRGDIVVDDREGDRWVGSLACRLASEIIERRALFFATLLHDVGKAIGSRDHSERGAEMARAILGRLGFGKEEIDTVCLLVRHHLTMYHMATRRDLDDPATAAELGEVVGDVEHLRDLYLLTVADLSTTSPTSMTSWKARMLDELYVATERFLRGNVTGRSRSLEQRLAETQALVKGEEARAFAARFVASMPERYALSNRAEDIAAHAALVAQHLSGRAPASVLLLPTRRLGVAEIAVVAEDRPGLLAAIAAALAASRLSVHAAQIHSCTIRPGRPLAFDVFFVHHSAGPAGVKGAIGKLERHLAAVLRGDKSPAELARLARRPARRGEGPRVHNRVIVDNRAAPGHTVVEIVTRDRPGLLFELSHALYRQGLSIAVAKLATEGTRVVDVFYVSERDGKKVSDEARVRAITRALEQLLEGLEEDRGIHGEASL